VHKVYFFCRYCYTSGSINIIGFGLFNLEFILRDTIVLFLLLRAKPSYTNTRPSNADCSVIILYTASLSHELHVHASARRFGNVDRSSSCPSNEYLMLELSLCLMIPVALETFLLDLQNAKACSPNVTLKAVKRGPKKRRFTPRWRSHSTGLATPGIAARS
jgi:hypothetical protein